MKDSIVNLDKIINRFIFQTKKFIEFSAFPYGLADLIKHQKTDRLSNDYEYFAITKSLKTLVSIKKLISNGNNEDVFILVRSIFENYLSCRYLNENYNDEEIINSFIHVPINLVSAHYNIREEGIIYDRQDQIVGLIENPSTFKLGRDKDYYSYFYSFLSNFAHCNFGIVDCYLDKDSFRFDKVNYKILSRLFTVFVFAKIFELVVTVHGEDFKDARTEKACYRLMEDSLLVLDKIFDFMINEYSKLDEDDFHEFLNKRMKKMMKKMKKSLNEELGSIIKK